MKKCYRYGCLCVAIFYLIGNAQTKQAQAGGGSILLFENFRRSGKTNEWWLTKNRIKLLPRWKYVREEIPLPLKNAITIATNWIIAKEGPGVPYIDSIAIDSLNSNESEYRYVYYYKFVYSVRFFDQGVCVVLMDGTILEPDDPYGVKWKPLSSVVTNKVDKPLEMNRPKQVP
jgi:hypothetical protein